ncbi:formylglycine-generating enzyme family protein [Streptomyces sp. PRKS01-29]|nr:formylglycine-generating enzyme family protein [Streptomyces sabulosicollis]MBI0293184.1 formylglycine-generating enzyme family protein [Streptomyces sabulosicollis]
MSACCGSARQERPPAPEPSLEKRDYKRGTYPEALLPLAGGVFEMGDAFDEGYEADGESPVHEVELSPFAVAATPVTNAMFATFVQATGYRTGAERYGSSAVFHLAVRGRPEDILGAVPGAEWWLVVRGADWAHPDGPGSSWRERHDHPVVHVSWHDAQAYCAWAGVRLPTEAEWEYAARGGLTGKRYPWGDELEPEGVPRCAIFRGTFPERSSPRAGHLTTTPVRSFPPNGYELHQTSGNVWEWCADWYSPVTYRQSPRRDPRGPSRGRDRVTRGGSYLCHHSYCNRYRVAARTGNTPESATANCGFRVAADLAVTPEDQG